MTAPVPLPGPGKFALLAVLGEAARVIAADFPSYFRLALAPFLFCWGFSAVQSGTEPGAGATTGASGYYLRFLLVLTMTFLLSAFMVSVHRLALIGAVGDRVSTGLRIAREEARHAACFIGLTLFAVAGYYLLFLIFRYTQVGGMFMVQVSMLVFVVIFTVLFLCSFVLVEEALGIKTGFIHAFRIAAGNRLRLVALGVLAVMVPLLAGMAALGFAFAGLGADFPARALRGAALTLIVFAVLGYWAVALSVAYRQVTGWIPPEGENE